MKRDQPASLATRAGGAPAAARGDVRALLALIALDEGIAKQVLFNPDWKERP